MGDVHERHIVVSMKEMFNVHAIHIMVIRYLVCNHDVTMYTNQQT